MASYIDRRRNINPYPFKGTFYTKGTSTGGDDLFDEPTEEETILLETDCDITETSRALPQVQSLPHTMYISRLISSAEH